MIQIYVHQVCAIKFKSLIKSIPKQFSKIGEKESIIEINWAPTKALSWINWGPRGGSKTPTVFCAHFNSILDTYLIWFIKFIVIFKGIVFLATTLYKRIIVKFFIQRSFLNRHCSFFKQKRHNLIKILFSLTVLIILKQLKPKKRSQCSWSLFNLRIVGFYCYMFSHEDNE